MIPLEEEWLHESEKCILSSSDTVVVLENK